MAILSIDEVQKIASQVWSKVPAVDNRGTLAKWANDQLAQLIGWLRQAQVDPSIADRTIMRQTYLEAFRTKIQPVTAGMGRQSIRGGELHQAVHDEVMMPLLEGKLDIEDALDILQFVVGYASGLRPVEVEHV